MISTTDYERSILLGRMRELGVKRVLEVGAFYGETTRLLREVVAENGGYVSVIDPMKYASEFLRNGFARHLSNAYPKAVNYLERVLNLSSYEKNFWKNVGPENKSSVHLFKALSSDAEVLESSDEHLQEFDAVFIDGDHSYEGAKLDLEKWGTRVREGGSIFVHDSTKRFPGVMRAINDWNGDSRVEIRWPKKDSLCEIRVIKSLRGPNEISSVRAA